MRAELNFHFYFKNIFTYREIEIQTTIHTKADITKCLVKKGSTTPSKGNHT
jgi:hypothetical protein